MVIEADLKLTIAFKTGYKNAKQGHSIHYNPFRHTGTSEQFTDWEKGHKYFFSNEIVPSSNQQKE